MRAARIGSPETLEILIAAKPDLEKKNLHGQTALLIAASSAPPEKIELLVNAGADLETRDIRQWSVLDHDQFLANEDAVHARMAQVFWPVKLNQAVDDVRQAIIEEREKEANDMANEQAEFEVEYY